MKRVRFLLKFGALLGLHLLHVWLSGCAQSRSSTLTQRQFDLQRHFVDCEGCFVLLDVEDRSVWRFNPVRCDERFSPCSTFKIANSLIGLDAGVIPDADHEIAWDGIQRDRDELNQNHTLRTAMHNSVVWYYQELARRVGEARMRRWIDAIGYGNRDLSGGLTRFWLGSSLKISADEQIEFLERLRQSDLPFTDRSMDIVKDILVINQGDDWKLRGKTGSSRASDRAGDFNAQDLGWFVGWLERGGRSYVFVCNVSGNDAFGPKARSITLAILRERQLLAGQ